ncbi:very long-chain acyl-CoA synthetase-like [Sphaeramia orbicularis]|uniref:very long-chain acyl-CoA synthetase-like n=1 Tax=Sphaeramia orbicularis TaxID=375764 RepID=UPI00117CC44E|nr:very long-chain acyl-CoA synthetase-like [Sphaeramia orbicularis]
MFFSLLYTLLAGLVLVLPVLLYLRNPYLVQDVRYCLSVLQLALSLNRCKRRNPCYTILDRFLDLVSKHPHKPFLYFEGSCFTYIQADRESNKAAWALRNRVRSGDTVAVFMGNEPQFVWLWLGLSKLGCTAALLNTNIRSKSLVHCFSCCDAKVLLVGADLQGAVVEVLPTLQSLGVQVLVLGVDCAVEGLHSLTGSLSESSDQPVPVDLRSKITLKSPALYIYTSGTTGLPKAAVINYERLWMASFLQLIAGVRSDDIMYVYLPLYHSAAFMMGLCGSIERGIPVVLRRKFSASQFWNDCRKYNVTVIQYIGEVMRYLCNVPKTEQDRDHKVRLALGNGIRTDTWNEFLQRFGNISICECYGATEGNIGFVNYVGKVGAIGKENFLHKMGNPYALISYDTEKEEPVRDSRGFCVRVPTGETGLLVGQISARSPFSGYSKNKQQTEKKILRDVFVKGDQYFNSGDLLRIDRQGFVFFQDRIGDTFRWKGENVATTEVADHLLMVDCIEEANVYGVKVPGHEGRIGMASVKLKENMDFDCTATYQHVKNHLPSYARPRFIRVQDALDVTGTFKQLKGKLAKEGFDPALIQDPLFYLDDSQGYVPMSRDIFDAIAEGRLRL